MNPETVNTDSPDNTATETEQPEVIEVDNRGTKVLLPQNSSTQSFNAQWQQYGERVAAFLQTLPSYVTRFFIENKGPLGTIGLIVLALISVKLILALLDAIDDIPLIAPTLELIGIAYTGWFIYRYLLTATNRQELSEQIKMLKDRVVGSGS
ncbi:MAG: CAAD domain-containing protein [Coleofasciculaceae cyanobacterium]